MGRIDLMDKRTYRGWMNYLEDRGLLTRVKRKVDPKYQLAALTKKLDGKGAILFEQVGDYKMPVVSNLCFNRECYAWCLEVEKEHLVETILRAMEDPKPCNYVQDAPFKEGVMKGNFDLLESLPVPVYHEDDAGRFITAGLVVAKDPETGRRNVSIHRLQVIGKDSMCIYMLPRHLGLCYDKAKSAGHPLEVAVVIGVGPLALLASQAILPFGIDEFEVASRLHGDGSLELTKCLTVDVEVPAESEIVIEGSVQIEETATEGPFGEFPMYYSPPGKKPVVRVKAISFRKDPVYYSILPASKEHLLVGGLAREASLLKSLRASIPSVRQVHLTPGGTCRYHLVISIEKRNEGEAKNAILAAMANNADIKHVVVVDKDVDIFNMEEVEWAIATRFQGDQDLFIIPSSQGSRLDPSTRNGVGAKMGIDATVPIGQLHTRYKRIKIPDYEKVTLRDFL
jgi:2,5-furandicarboxylate decarboxylase 1